MTEGERILWTRYLIESHENSQLLDQARELLVRLEAVLGIDSRPAMNLKGIIASLVAEESPLEAVACYEDLLLRQLTLLGPESPDALATTHALVFFKLKAGLREQAFELSRGLLKTQIRYFGPRHPDSIQTRLMVANLGGKARFVSAEQTRELIEEILIDAQQVLGQGDELVQIQTHLALWTARTGDYATALKLADAASYHRSGGPRQRRAEFAARIAHLIRRKLGVQA